MSAVIPLSPAFVAIEGARAAIGVGELTLSAMARAIKALYGIAGSVDDWFDKHIEELKRSTNSTIARTGEILEAAKRGFGIAYVSSLVVVAVGQSILGNPLAVVTSFAGVTNPVAMTCGALGAIYYGWSVLPTEDQERVLTSVSKGLETGIELIRAIIRFVIEKSKELLSPKNIEEIKKYVKSTAALFGKTLGEVTHKLADVVGDTAERVRRKSGVAIETTIEAASGVYRHATANSRKAAHELKEKLDETVTKIRKKNS